MFQGAKRRITEGARRARIVTVGGGSGAQGGAQQAPTASGRGDPNDSISLHVMDLMMDSGFHRNSNLAMSNGKGPSSSNVGGSGGPANAYFVDDDINNDIDMDFLDYGERLGSDRMFEEPWGFSGAGNHSGNSFFGSGGGFPNHFSRSMRGQHGNREPVDKVVHADFFNKFDDLLDMDDLN